MEIADRWKLNLTKRPTLKESGHTKLTQKLDIFERIKSLELKIARQEEELCRLKRLLEIIND